MGLTLRNNVKTCHIELDGGYGMLLTIRKEVAKQWDKEFGEHYGTLGQYRTDDEWKIFDKRTNEILCHERFKGEDEDLVDFLFQSDCDGKIGYKTCKKIYDLLKNSKNKSCLRYAFYSKNDWEDLRELLLSCYKHRANLYWR